MLGWGTAGGLGIFLAGLGVFFWGLRHMRGEYWRREARSKKEDESKK